MSLSSGREAGSAAEAETGGRACVLEAWHDQGNRDLFERVAAAHDIDPSGVPAVFVAGGAWIGDSGPFRQAIEAAVERCAADRCPDVAGAVIAGCVPEAVPEEEKPETGGTVVSVPLLGSHDVSGDSLIWATALIAFVERRLPAVVAMTVAMAAGVSLLELPCTVGFPVVWTNLLADRGVPTSEYAFLLLVYLLIFLVDEIAVLVAAVVAMRIGRIDEQHGRVLKLGGGMLMAVLAVVMLTRPELLEQLSGTAFVFGVAAALTAAAMLVSAGVGRSREASAGPAAHRSPSRRTRP